MRRKLTAEPVRNKPGWLAVPCRSSDEAKITCKACGTGWCNGVVARDCGTGLWYEMSLGSLFGFGYRRHPCSAKGVCSAWRLVRGQSICLP